MDLKTKIFDQVAAAKTGQKTVNEATNTILGLFGVSKCADTIIDYIENDAEIAMPIDEMFNEDGSNITKKKYGKVLLKYLVKELREHFC
jgi:hypothetical protein